MHTTTLLAYRSRSRRKTLAVAYRRCPTCGVTARAEWPQAAAKCVCGAYVRLRTPVAQA